MTYVYRAYSEDDRLPYVGMADNVHIRMSQHERNGAEWLDQLQRIETTEYLDRDQRQRPKLPLSPRRRRSSTSWATSAREAALQAEMLEAIKREAECDPLLSAEQRSRLAVLLLAPGGDHEGG